MLVHWPDDFDKTLWCNDDRIGAVQERYMAEADLSSCSVGAAEHYRLSVSCVFKSGSGELLPLLVGTAPDLAVAVRRVAPPRPASSAALHSVTTC